MKVSQIKSIVNKTSKRYNKNSVKKLKAKVVANEITTLLVNEDRLPLRRAVLRDTQDVVPNRANERILGSNDMLDMFYVHQAITAAKSVGRIILRNGLQEIGYATGFLISPRIILTNHHVFRTAASAAEALIQFNYELDINGRPKSATRFELQPDILFYSNSALDMAIVAVNSQPFSGNEDLSNFGFLRMVDFVGKVNPKEFVTIIQHPGGQPKQIALRENQLLEIEGNHLLYKSDTAQGSSGSPVFNDSWQIVGLHHSGVPKTNRNGDWLLKNGDIATAQDDDADIDWIANEGIRASKIVNHLRNNLQESFLKTQLFQVVNGELKPTEELQPKPSIAIGVPNPQMSNALYSVESTIGGAKITFPVSVNISIDTNSTSNNLLNHNTDDNNLLEAYKIPYIDPDYSNREGYDPLFLGVEVPNLSVYNKGSLVIFDDSDNDIYIPYEHFSIVQHKRRRLALFTSSNIDANRNSKRPDPNQTYTRKALGGLSKNDRERWTLDPRISPEFQLPDVFFTKDRASFDKGHLVRRDDVAWGETYEEVRRANGDTFHVTNCSPQVFDFNRSSKGGLWGKLENNILKQAKTEKLTVFTGPILRNDDRYFDGVGADRSQLRVKIPNEYWKIVVAVNNNKIEAYGYILKQDLSNVDFEFAVPAEWIPYTVSINEIAQRTTNIRIPSLLIKNSKT